MSFPDLISIAHAQINLPNPICSDCTIIGVLETVTKYLLAVGIPIVAIMVIWGAYQIMFAQGEAEKVRSGVKTVVFAAVGYGIVLLAWGVISLVKELLGAN